MKKKIYDRSHLKEQMLILKNSNRIFYLYKLRSKVLVHHNLVSLENFVEKTENVS